MTDPDDADAARVRLDVGEPQHGWITVTLRIDGGSWEGDGSHIIDCIAALAQAALHLAAGRPPDEVVFFQEPPASVLTFVEDGDLVHLTITDFHHVHDRAQQRGTVAFEATAPRAALARAIWDGLHRIERALGLEAFHARWREPFPERTVAELGDHVR